MRVLLTGGRAPATLELARLLRLGGAEVFLAESLPATVTALSSAVTRAYRVPAPREDARRFAFALRDVIRREVIDLVISTCEELFHVARGADVLEGEARLFIPPIATLRRLHSKHEFIAWAEGLGLTVPETRLLDSRAALEAHFEAEGGEGWVFKPEFSRFSTAVVLRPASIEAMGDVVLSAERPWVAQRFIEGRPLCSWSLIVEGQLRAHAVYPVGFSAGRAAIDFQSEDHPGVEAWVRRFAADTGATGQLAFDFIERDGEVYAIECNPRLTSGVHLFRGDARLIEALEPGEGTLKPRGPRSAIWFALWIYGLWGALTGGELRAWLRAIFTARPALWSWRDPLPFLLQGLSYSRLLAWAWRRRISAVEASTLDIEWNGEP